MWCTNPKSVESIKGLTYIPNYIDEALEKEILSVIDGNPWKQEILRRQQFYGKTYYHTTTDRVNLQPPTDEEVDGNSNSNGVNHVNNCFNIAALSCITSKLVEDGYFRPEKGPDQILVNEYVERTGIGSHFDDFKAFGPVIATISLGSPIWMILKKPKHLTNSCPEILDQVRIFLEPKSLFIMAEDVRYKWRHSINRSRQYFDPRTQEIVDRSSSSSFFKRISLTVRNVLEGRKKVLKDSPCWMTENVKGTDCIH